MINSTILFLTVSDCMNETVVRKWNVDARVNHNFEISTVRPLKQVFSNVIVYDYLQKYVEIGVKKTNEEIVDIVRKKRPEYVLWPSMTYEILESTFDEIRQHGSKVIGWFFDDEVRFDEYSKWWIPHLDYCFTVDRESIQKYTDLDADAMHFLVYSNPEVFQRLDLPKRYDLSFVGTKIADREELVNNLRAMGFLIKAFGRGWDSGYITLEQMIEIYNTSRINLCYMKSYGVNTRPQMKCKIFDICMCGGFLLCEYIPGIEEYYEIGKEIVCFNSLVDLQEKIAYYLENKVERERIAEAGYKRAVRDHSCQRRLSYLFRTFQNFHEDNDGSPVRVKVPWNVKKQKSEFHLRWAKALLLEKYKFTRWMDEMVLATLYYPPNAKVLIYYLWCFFKVMYMKIFGSLGKLMREE